jgi:hypothetical protein
MVLFRRNINVVILDLPMSVLGDMVFGIRTIIKELWISIIFLPFCLRKKNGINEYEMIDNSGERIIKCQEKKNLPSIIIVILRQTDRGKPNTKLY